MSYIPSSRARVLGLLILAVGLLFISLRILQTPFGVGVLMYGSPTSSDVRVRIEGSEAGLSEAVERAVEEWRRASNEYNSIVSLECFIARLFPGCSPVCSEAPQISITGGDDYNILIVFTDEPPSEGYVADFKIMDQKAYVRLWKELDSHKAYQVVLHLIGRILGVKILDRRATLFGAIPATSIPENEILGRDTPALNYRVKPTTLEVAGIVASRLGYEGVTTTYFTTFRAYDEPDFTIPALASPALITSGLYILSRRRRRVG
jgi:hypothetical protein